MAIQKEGNERRDARKCDTAERLMKKVTYKLGDLSMTNNKLEAFKACQI